MGHVCNQILKAQMMHVKLNMTSLKPFIGLAQNSRAGLLNIEPIAQPCFFLSKQRILKTQIHKQRNEKAIVNDS